MSEPTRSAILRISDSKTSELIDLYISEECLWNTASPSYRDKGARCQANERIAQKLAISHFGGCHVTVKFRNLRNSYCQELKKIANSIQSGASEEDVYRPKVFWFDKMDSFLRPHLQYTRCSTSTGTMAHENDGLNEEGTDSDQWDALAEPLINEVKMEVESDDETQVDTLAINREVDALANNREVDALANHELEENELTPEQTLNIDKPAFDRKKYISVEIEVEQKKTGRVLRKRKKANDEEIHAIEPKIDRKLIDLARSYKKMERVLNSREKKNDDVFDNFARYVASTMREMGTYEALALQPRIVELIETHRNKK